MVTPFTLMRGPVLARTLLLAFAFTATLAVAAPAKTSFRVEEATSADIQSAILAKKLTATELVHKLAGAR